MKNLIAFLVILTGCSTHQPPTASTPDASYSALGSYSLPMRTAEYTTHTTYLEKIELTLERPVNNKYGITLSEINEKGEVKVFSKTSKENLVATKGEAFTNEDGSPSEAFGRIGLTLKDTNQADGSVLLERRFCSIE